MFRLVCGYILGVLILAGTIVSLAATFDLIDIYTEIFGRILLTTLILSVSIMGLSAVCDKFLTKPKDEQS